MSSHKKKQIHRIEGLWNHQGDASCPSPAPPENGPTPQKIVGKRPPSITSRTSNAAQLQDGFSLLAPPCT